MTDSKCSWPAPVPTICTYPEDTCCLLLISMLEAVSALLYCFGSFSISCVVPVCFQSQESITTSFYWTASGSRLALHAFMVKLEMPSPSQSRADKYSRPFLPTETTDKWAVSSRVPWLGWTKGALWRYCYTILQQWQHTLAWLTSLLPITRESFCSIQVEIMHWQSAPLLAVLMSPNDPG